MLPPYLRHPGCIELMIDLLDQLPTRRFFRPLLVDKHVVV